MYQVFCLIHVADQLASWGVSQRVEYVQEHCRSLESLYSGEFDDLVLDPFSIWTIELESLHGVCKQLLDRQEETLVHDGVIKEVWRELNGYHAVVVFCRPPHMRNVWPDHHKVQS